VGGLLARREELVDRRAQGVDAVRVRALGGARDVRERRAVRADDEEAQRPG